MITSYETQTVSNAMIQAIVADELKRQRTAREAELEKKVTDLEMQLDVSKQKEATIYTRYADMTDRCYREPEHSWISNVWWAIVGWTVLGFGALWDVIRW